MRVWIVTTKEGNVSVFKNAQLVELSMKVTYSRSELPTRVDQFGGQMTWADGTKAVLHEVKDDPDHL